MRLSFRTKIIGASAVLLVASLPAFAATLFSQAMETEGAGGPYVPAGTLYDNEQNNGTTSLVSQDSSGAFLSRSADDFIIDDPGCVSQVFDISLIRVQMVQQNAAPQAFGLDLYNDDGTGNAPTAGISPFSTFAQTTQTNLGPFGTTTSIFEASFDTTGLQLNGGTKYWVSGFGTNAATNAAAFNNFFAASGGAAATVANGVTIAPGQGVPNWTLSGPLVGGADLFYSFAVDGTCAVGGGPGGGQTTFDVAVPTLSTVGIALMAALLALGAFFVLRRN